MDWKNLIVTVGNLKEEFEKSYKCINKSAPVTDVTLNKHIDILILKYNSVSRILKAYYHKLTPDHKSESQKIFSDLRDKLIRIFSRYKLRILVPNYLGEEVDKSLVDDTQSENLSSSESESESDHKTEPIMPLSALDFLNFASKILPEFDGRSENLQRFLDAISLAKTQIEGHENLCVELIKTKLVGSSRNLLENENTIDQIVDCLKTKVKSESTEVISAKIMNIKQNNKTANQFSVEIENLTKSLENSYIREGISHSLAEKYSTQAAVRAFSTNASNDKVKLIMQSGTFQNMNDVVSKFVNSSTEQSQGSNVFHFNSNNRFNRTNRYFPNNNFSNNNRNFYRYGNNNFRGNNNNRGNYRPRGNPSIRFNNNQRQQRPRQFNNVRAFENVPQENPQGPQMINLREARQN